MGQRKVRLITLVAVAAAGLTMLGAGQAAARPAASATSTTPAPPFAMLSVGENLNDPANPLCGTGSTALEVDDSGDLVEGQYQEVYEFGCSVEQVGGPQLASGWGDVTRVFADPATSTIFSIDTAGDLTSYSLNGQMLSGGTVIGSGWNTFTQVTYAGSGVFYAVDGNGNLFWYRDLDLTGRAADWANGGVGAIIGGGWQNFPLVFASGGAVYATTNSGDLLWYGYSDPTSDSGTWADNSGAVVDSGGWDTVANATADPGRAANHVLIHAVGQDGKVRFYDYLAADTGSDAWSPVSGIVVLGQ